MYSYKDIFSNKKKVLFVTAHPDDIDVFFGGILCRLNKDKKKTFVLVVTSGGRGSQDKKISEMKLAELRKEEQIKSLRYLGLNQKDFFSLEYLDGQVENSMRLIGKISRVIRRFKPEIVCTHEPHGFYHSLPNSGKHYVNHRDHRNTGLSVLDAVYPFSRDLSFFRDHQKQGMSPHKVFEILFTGAFQVNTKINVTEVVGKKRAALLSHKSQFDKKKVEEILEGFKEKDRYFEAGNYIKLAW